MKLYHTTIFTKVFGLIRFYVLKLFYVKRATISKKGVIGAKNEFFIAKTGEVTLGDKFITADNATVLAYGKLSIGANFFMNSFSRIVAMKEVSIGNNVSLASFVTILDHNHDFKIENSQISLEGYVKDTVTIGNNVWIGDKVTITKGVKIGDNVIVGANSLVIKDVPSNVIVGGVPAKVLTKIM